MTKGVTFDDATAQRLEALYRTDDASRRRRAVLGALKPIPGEKVVDIGTGPGFLALEAADAVGSTGHVVGIDSSESMLALARARCAERSWVDLRSGDASALPLDDGQLDIAISVQVYEYIPDVERALAEMFRVLRPGGRGAIVSTDWRSAVWHSEDEERSARVFAAWAEHCAHQDLPRTLAPRLRSVGFELGPQQVISQLGTTYDPKRFTGMAIDLIQSFVAGRRGVTPEDAEAWAAEQRRLGEQGKFFACVHQFLFVVHK